MLVNCLLNVPAICVGEVNIFSLNVMVLCLGCVFFCWLIRVLSSKEYVCYYPSVCLGVPSIYYPIVRECVVCFVVVCTWCVC